MANEQKIKITAHNPEEQHIADQLAAFSNSIRAEKLKIAYQPEWVKTVNQSMAEFDFEPITFCIEEQLIVESKKPKTLEMVQQDVLAAFSIANWYIIKIEGWVIE